MSSQKRPYCKEVVWREAGKGARDRESLGVMVRGALRDILVSNQVSVLGKVKPKDERSVRGNTNNQKAGEGNAAVALLWTKALGQNPDTEALIPV